MQDTDLGRAVVVRFLQLLGVEGACTPGEAGIQWSLWGASQRVWSEPVKVADYDAAWTVRLRTRALDGFIGSPAQLVALSTRLTLPTLAGVARSADQPTRLELASSFVVHQGNIGWVAGALAVAARVQAIEARLFSESKGLAWVGLNPVVDMGAKVPETLLREPDSLLTGGLDTEGSRQAWPESEISECADVLALRARAHAIRTPRGMTATFVVDSTTDTRSILEARADGVHPLLGRGLSVILRIPARGGPLDAIAANEREVGPWGNTDALGGWRAPQGGLLQYSSFYPDALYRRGLALQLVLSCARRAGNTISR